MQGLGFCFSDSEFSEFVAFRIEGLGKRLEREFAP